jgi:hypothetical protein
MTETIKRKREQKAAQEHIRDAIELLRLALELLAKKETP